MYEGTMTSCGNSSVVSQQRDIFTLAMMKLLLVYKYTVGVICVSIDMAWIGPDAKLEFEEVCRIWVLKLGELEGTISNANINENEAQIKIFGQGAPFNATV